METFITGKSRYGNGKTIVRNLFFDMDKYPLAKLDFVERSGLLPKEQLITPDQHQISARLFPDMI